MANKIESIEYYEEEVVYLDGEIWLKIISVEKDDIKDYWPKHIQIGNVAMGQENCYLQVVDQGVVNCSGGPRDASTIFTLHQWAEENHPTQFITEAGPCKKYILYMSDEHLRARPYTHGEVGKDTMFLLHTSSDKKHFAMEPEACLGNYIKFDDSGDFIYRQDNTDADGIKQQKALRYTFLPLIVNKFTTTV